MNSATTYTYDMKFYVPNVVMLDKLEYCKNCTNGGDLRGVTLNNVAGN